MSTTSAKEVVTRILTRALAIRDQREATYRDDYKQLVKRCAGGEEITSETIDKSLETWNIPMEKFWGDVELRMERMELRNELDNLSESVETIPGIEKKIDDATATRDRAIEVANITRDRAVANAQIKYNGVVDPLNLELGTAKENKQTLDQKKKDLESCAPDEAKAELEDASNEVDKARQAVKIASGKKPDKYRYGAHAAGEKLVQVRRELEHFRHARVLSDVKKRDELIALAEELEELAKPIEHEQSEQERLSVEEAEKALELANERYQRAKAALLEV